MYNGRLFGHVNSVREMVRSSGRGWHYSDGRMAESDCVAIGNKFEENLKLQQIRKVFNFAQWKEFYAGKLHLAQKAPIESFRIDSIIMSLNLFPAIRSPM